MNPTTPTDAPGAQAPWWLALHAALMPDYNRKAATYWWLMLLLGVCSLGLAAQQVGALPRPAQPRRCAAV